MCNPRFFLAGNHARNGVGKCDHCRHAQRPVTLGNCFQVFHTISDQQWDKEQEKSTKEEATKFEKFKRRKPRGKPGRRRREHFSEEQNTLSLLWRLCTLN